MKNFNTTYPGHQSSQSALMNVKLEDSSLISSNSSTEINLNQEHPLTQTLPLIMDPASLQSRFSLLTGLEASVGLNLTRSQLTHCEILLKNVRESFSRDMDTTELSYLTKMLNYYVGLLSQEKMQLVQKLHTVEMQLEQSLKELPKEQESTQKKKRRMRRYAHQIHRVYQCPIADCSKSYGSEGSLYQHVNLKHPDFDLKLWIDQNCKKDQAI